MLVASYLCERLASFATSAYRKYDSEAMISLFDSCKRIQAACCFWYALRTWDLNLSVCPFIAKLDRSVEYPVRRRLEKYIDGPIWFDPVLVSSVITDAGGWSNQAKA
jgi:hypothetical protein